MATLVLEDSTIRSFDNSRGPEIGSRVHFMNLKLALWGLDFGFTSGFMGGGSGALLEVQRTPLDLFPESFNLKQKAELVQISIQTRSTLLGKEPMRCHRLLVNRLFDKQLIKREILFIKEVITKEESIAPKANLLAWYIDTNLPPVGAWELAAFD